MADEIFREENPPFIKQHKTFNMLGMPTYRQAPTTPQQLHSATQARKILPNPTKLATQTASERKQAAPSLKQKEPTKLTTVSQQR